MCASANFWSAARWARRSVRAGTAALPLLLAAALAAACATIDEVGPPPPVELADEWDYETSLPGDEGGFCIERGNLRFTDSTGAIAGTITPFQANCGRPTASSLTGIRLTADSIAFTAGICAFRGMLMGAGPDSVAGALTCTGRGDGTWFAQRVGPPAALVLQPGDRTLSVGGTQTYRATLYDAGDHVLYGRSVTWSSSAPSAVGVVIVDSVFQTEVSVIGAAPGSSQVRAVAGGVGATVSVTVASAGLVRVAAGYQHTCGLTASGAAWCWGANASGRLGTGDTIDVQEPVPVTGGHVFTEVAPGWYHTCALDSGGAAWCWGYNGAGWLGDGTTVSRSAPAAVAGGRVFTSIVVGTYHACALTAAGAAWCWGAGAEGQLGDSARVPRSTPVPVAGGHAFVELAAGVAHTCGRTAAGAAWCWGSNDRGQQGTGSTDTVGTAYPSLVAGGLAFSAITAGRMHSCGVAGGAAYCWGSGLYGQTGIGSRSLVRTPTPVVGGLAFRTVTTRNDHTCGVAASGVAWCWGSNGAGQAGVATPTETDAPVAVSGGHLFGSVSAGGVHTCALDDGGIAWCWGFNFLGQLGDGTRTDRRAPVRVVGQP